MYITSIDKAISDLKQGKFILVYDDDSREGETDFVIASQFVKPESIRIMRQDGGGLIFLMTSYPVAQRFQLPFLSDMFADISKEYPILEHLIPNDIPYDAKSSFSLYINHRKTFTGITDQDRSLTMNKFAETIQNTQTVDSNNSMKTFGLEFRTPGHIPICVAAPTLLNERKGHTELIVALLSMAGLIPSGSGCEIMGNDGKALSRTQTKEYAQNHGYAFLEGKEIIRAWKQWSE